MTKVVSEQLAKVRDAAAEWGWPRTAAFGAFVAAATLLGVLGGGEYRALVDTAMGAAGAVLLTRKSS